MDLPLIDIWKDKIDREENGAAVEKKEEEGMENGWIVGRIFADSKGKYQIARIQIEQVISCRAKSRRGRQERVDRVIEAQIRLRVP